MTVPLYDKARLRAFLDSWEGDRRRFPDSAVTDFGKQLVRESGVQVGSRVVVTRGPHDGTELVVSAVNASEAEVYAASKRGGRPYGWWPIECVCVKDRAERPARETAGVH